MTPSHARAAARLDGANRVVDYKHERFEDVVRDLDVVIDTRGGADYARLVKTLKSSGIIVSLLGREQATKKNAPEALSRRIRKGFVYVQPDGTVIQRVAQLIADRALKDYHRQAVRPGSSG